MRCALMSIVLLLLAAVATLDELIWDRAGSAAIHIELPTSFQARFRGIPRPAAPAAVIHAATAAPVARAQLSNLTAAPVTRAQLSNLTAAAPGPCGPHASPIVGPPVPGRRDTAVCGCIGAGTRCLGKLCVNGSSFRPAMCPSPRQCACVGGPALLDRDAAAGGGGGRELRGYCDAADLALLRGLMAEPAAKVGSFDRNCQQRYRMNTSVARWQDKANAKELVARAAPGLRLVAQLGPVVRSAMVAVAVTPTRLASLPRRFFFKGTHGSGMVLLVDVPKNASLGAASTVRCVKIPCGLGDCHGGTPRDTQAGRGCSFPSLERLALQLEASCRMWLVRDHGKIMGEPSYSAIEPGCMFEAAMVPDPVLSALGVMYFHGRPLLIMVDGKTVTEKARSSYWTADGRHLIAGTTSILRDVKGCASPQPSLERIPTYCTTPQLAPPSPRAHFGEVAFGELMWTAQRLAKTADTEHVRVDFMVITGHAGPEIAFQELTFTTSACYQRFTPVLLDQMVGAAGDSSDGNSPRPACLAAVVRLIACDRSGPYAINSTHVRGDRCHDRDGYNFGKPGWAELLAAERFVMWTQGSRPVPTGRRADRPGVGGST